MTDAKDLKERCSQFYTLQLPGQPRVIHIGTCSLVRDLEKEVDRLRDVATQAVAVIKSVQDYEQPDDPTCENALTMCDHEVFDFDVDAAIDVLNAQEEADAPQE